MTFGAFVLGRMLGVNDPDASLAVQTAFVVSATVALTGGILVLGYLSGVVLRSKLPAFPIRVWLALYAAMGAAFGAVSAFAWLSPDVPPDPDPVDTDIVVGLAVGAVIAGAAIGAAVGSLQALILRRVAQGLGLWIACSAIAGSLFVIAVPAVVYGPQSPFETEVMTEVLALAITIFCRLRPVARGAPAASARVGMRRIRPYRSGNQPSGESSWSLHCPRCLGNRTWRILSKGPSADIIRCCQIYP